MWTPQSARISECCLCVQCLCWMSSQVIGESTGKSRLLQYYCCYYHFVVVCVCFCLEHVSNCLFTCCFIGWKLFKGMNVCICAGIFHVLSKIKSVINMPVMLDAKFPNRTSSKVREENKEYYICIFNVLFIFQFLWLLGKRHKQQIVTSIISSYLT